MFDLLVASTFSTPASMSIDYRLFTRLAFLRFSFKKNPNELMNTLNVN